MPIQRMINYVRVTGFYRILELLLGWMIFFTR